MESLERSEFITPVEALTAMPAIWISLITSSQHNW
jgi:hypothetical protein